MNSKELKKKYLEFFKERGHAIIKSYSLIPEHDPTVLFTTAGMHPLVPYLLGQTHPMGKRLTDVQKCIRTTDIDSVGDASHLTFFEMLGNWSLGDYFKKEAISWSFEFLTKVLKFEPEQIHATCFAGDENAPRDEESASVWRGVGIPSERIHFLPREDNWWGPAGSTGPCGPCTEMFIDTGKPRCSRHCRPGCGCGKYFEIWNDVFMEYNKLDEGKFEKLKQRNVDTGMGVERTIAMLNKKKTVYDIEAFAPLIEKIKELSGIKKSSDAEEKSIRIIADHVRSATFILGDDKAIEPSNIDQGYVLRRFIRRAIRHGKLLGINSEFLTKLAETVIDFYKGDYDELQRNKSFIMEHLKKEDERFRATLEKGLKEFEKIVSKEKTVPGRDAFLLFQSYGFPIEVTKELATEKGIAVDEAGFKEEYEKHQAISRVGAEKKFRGGLSEASEATTRLHTATHLLNEALRRVVSKDIVQKGSNITPERLRFDFNFNRKLTPEELKKVEDLVNQKIREEIDVVREEKPYDVAKREGAQAEFGAKYPSVVSTYRIGDFSYELCGGPHVKNTRELGHFRIIKEESVAAGVRRIKAIVEPVKE